VIWEGPLKSRPYDHLAFAINNMHYDLNYVNKYLMPKRTAVGGTERPDSNLTILEFNYAMALTPWLRWTSWYQYIAQPNGLAFGAYPKQNLPGASVFGLKVMIMVDRFVGLSKARGPLVGNPGKTFSF
jgi:carbohydrate-selective porin OprB